MKNKKLEFLKDLKALLEKHCTEINIETEIDFGKRESQIQFELSDNDGWHDSIDTTLENLDASSIDKLITKIENED